MGVFGLLFLTGVTCLPPGTLNGFGFNGGGFGWPFFGGGYNQGNMPFWPSYGSGNIWGPFFGGYQQPQQQAPAQEAVYFGHATIVVTLSSSDNSTAVTDEDLTRIASTFAQKANLPTSYVTATLGATEAYHTTAAALREKLFVETGVAQETQQEQAITLIVVTSSNDQLSAVQASAETWTRESVAEACPQFTIESVSATVNMGCASYTCSSGELISNPGSVSCGGNCTDEICCPPPGSAESTNSTGPSTNNSTSGEVVEQPANGEDVPQVEEKSAYTRLSAWNTVLAPEQHGPRDDSPVSDPSLAGFGPAASR